VKLLFGRPEDEVMPAQTTVPQSVLRRRCIMALQEASNSRNNKPSVLSEHFMKWDESKEIPDVLPDDFDNFDNTSVSATKPSSDPTSDYGYAALGASSFSSIQVEPRHKEPELDEPPVKKAPVFSQSRLNNKSSATDLRTPEEKPTKDVVTHINSSREHSSPAPSSSIELRDLDSYKDGNSKVKIFGGVGLALALTVGTFLYLHNTPKPTAAPQVAAPSQPTAPSLTPVQEAPATPGTITPSVSDVDSSQEKNTATEATESKSKKVDSSSKKSKKKEAVHEPVQQAKPQTHSAQPWKDDTGNTNKGVIYEKGADGQWHVQSK